MNIFSLNVIYIHNSSVCDNSVCISYGDSFKIERETYFIHDTFVSFIDYLWEVWRETFITLLVTLKL